VIMDILQSNKWNLISDVDIRPSTFNQ